MSPTGRDVPGGRLTARVVPRAARDEVVGWDGATLQVRVTAPPVGGAANEAVCRLLARVLGCSRGAVSVEGGSRARTKRVRVAGLAPAVVAARLGRPPGPGAA